MDTIGDFLTQLRNAYQAHKPHVITQHSKVKEGLVSILKEMGYIADFYIRQEGPKKFIEVALRYYKQKPAVGYIERVSKPGRRIYVSADKIPFVRNGLGIAILSTSQGILTDKQARQRNVGGEILCKIA